MKSMKEIDKLIELNFIIWPILNCIYIAQLIEEVILFLLFVVWEE